MIVGLPHDKNNNSYDHLHKGRNNSYDHRDSPSLISIQSCTSLLGISSRAQENFADCTNYLPAGTAAKIVRSAPIATRFYSESK